MKTPIVTLIAAALLSGFLVALATAQEPGPEPAWVTVDAATTDSPAVAVDPTSTSPAPSPVDELASDPVGWGKSIYDAVRSGRYWYAVGAFLIVLTWAFRELVKKRIEWFATDRGGVAAVGISSLLLLFGTALMATTAPSWGLLWGVLTGTVAAMGGYAGLKKLVWPKS